VIREILSSKIMANLGVPPDENFLFCVLQLLNFGETYNFCKDVRVRSYVIKEPFNLLWLMKSEEPLENLKPATTLF
jgi:hypothetical protein